MTYEPPLAGWCDECGDMLDSTRMHLDSEAAVCWPCWRKYPQVLKDFTNRLVIKNARLERKLEELRDQRKQEQGETE